MIFFLWDVALVTFGFPFALYFALTWAARVWERRRERDRFHGN